MTVGLTSGTKNKAHHTTHLTVAQPATKSLPTLRHKNFFSNKIIVQQKHYQPFILKQL
jgi:hypothetical protein